jgi:hypothetical protein
VIRRLVRRFGKRVVLLAVTGVSLYILFPSLLSVFSAWRSLSTLDPYWAVLILVAEALSFASVWQLQRTALQLRGWFAVPISQLTANAVGRIVPGGGATASAIQIGMLRRTGVPVGRAATALAACSALQFAALLALPLLALPGIIAGAPVDRGLAVSGYIGAAALALLLGAGALAFGWDRPLLVAGRVAQWTLNKTVRRRRKVSRLPEKLLVERDFIRAVVGKRWKAAVLSASAAPAFDYLALLCALRAVGAHPRPSLVVLAYVGAALLALIPLTPGGLGFVEAGLVGTLALAGVSGGDALVATLAYRLAAFWLPIPIGGIAYLVFRRRYGALTPSPVPGDAPSPAAVPGSAVRTWK